MLQPLKVRMDPRVVATAADLKAMFDAQTAAAAEIAKNAAALDEVRKAQKGLRELTGVPEPLREKARDLADQFAKLEKGNGSREPGLFAAKGMAAMHGWLNGVYGTFTTADAAPTTQALATFKQLQKISAEQMAQLEQLRTTLKSVNEQLKSAGKPEIALSGALPGTRNPQGAEKAEE
jgi:septal ring factor EnvC (AmiA/AmiB activator)